MNHVDEVFRVTVDMIRDSSSFSSSRKSVVGAAVGDVVASNTVVAAYIRSTEKKDSQNSVFEGLQQP